MGGKSDVRVILPLDVRVVKNPPGCQWYIVNCLGGKLKKNLFYLKILEHSDLRGITLLTISEYIEEQSN